jgi:hypothetical protein
LRSLLTVHSQLTSLTLGYRMYQYEFDTVLLLAPHLNSFTCNHLHLDTDRSAWPCSWKELVMTKQFFNGETLACIPTDSLTRLAFGFGLELPSPSPTLTYGAYDITEADSLPDLMHRGLAKLARCPAWQGCGPVVEVILCVEDYAEEEDDISPEMLGSMLGALAPLANMKVHLSLASPGVGVGASAVQELGTALGNSLEQLVLELCELEDDFWPAVWAHLPGLRTLTIEDEVSGARDPSTIACFCSHATRPLHLRLGHVLYLQAGSHSKLENHCRVWGVPQVTVTAWD